MKITIWSLKGGVGKTSIALNLALSCNCKIITNERYSLLTDVLNEENLLQLGVSEKIPQLGKEDKIIFDMGGTVDKRIIDCLKQSELVLVPTTANDIDIQGCISTVMELQDYIEKEKITIIVNNTTGKKDLEKVRSIINQICEHKYKFFELKRSRALVNIFDSKKSIKEMSKKGLRKNSYRKINEQFNNLINFIEGKNEKI